MDFDLGFLCLVSLFRLCTASLKNLPRVTIDKQMKMQLNTYHVSGE